jgi:hypothetical protein
MTHLLRALVSAFALVAFATHAAAMMAPAKVSRLPDFATLPKKICINKDGLQACIDKCADMRRSRNPNADTSTCRSWCKGQGC